jgi:glutamine amidotransferase
MSPVRIGLVDYGMGNRRSVEKALQRVGAEVVQSGDAEVLRGCSGLFVPGVGAFPAAMRALREHGLVEVLREAIVPVFGSCLGMQLLFDSSEELGGTDGLGLLPGAVRRLDARGLKLPHIGWNEVRWRAVSPLVDGLPDPATFYHVHTYVPHPSDPAHVLGESDYGTPFASVVGDGRVFGAQFHPEKSSAHGLALLENFVSLCAKVPA